VTMSAFTYRCTSTDLNVQGWTSDAISEDAKESIYISTRCPACARIHFVDPTTGTVLGGGEQHVRQSAEPRG
jgi:hypothetical protein